MPVAVTSCLMVHSNCKQHDHVCITVQSTPALVSDFLETVMCMVMCTRACGYKLHQWQPA